VDPVPAQKSKSHRIGHSRISVLLVDDHRIVRDGVQCVLDHQPDIRVVASVGDADLAVQEAQRLKPALVLTEITMPGTNGTDATRVLADRVPDSRVVILSAHSSPTVVRHAIDTGARGFLPKDIGADELVHAVRAVASGERYISQRLAQALLDEGNGAGIRSPTVGDLTPTEQKILTLVVEGKSNSEVGAVIGLSRRTVEAYRVRLMRKLGIDNLPTLVRYAIRHGVIPL
jgi:DNA-binding NarL/FixJ family response regulator